VIDRASYAVTCAVLTTVIGNSRDHLVIVAAMASVKKKFGQPARG